MVKHSDKEALRAVRASMTVGRQVFRYANVPVMPEECYIALPEEGSVLVIPADADMVRILKGQNV